MIDIYVDDVTLKEIEHNPDGSFRLDFINTEKDEHIHMIASRAEMLNILRNVGQRCETTDIVHTVDIRYATKGAAGK